MENQIKSIYFRVLNESSKFAKLAAITNFDFDKIQALNPTADELAEICVSLTSFISMVLDTQNLPDECGIVNLSINIKQFVLIFKSIAKAIDNQDQEELSKLLDELEKLSQACKY